MLAQAVKIDNKQIELVKNWSGPTLIREIQLFIGFANFYQCFIQSFSKIAAFLPLLLKTTGLLDLASKTFKVNDDKIAGVDNKANKTAVNLSKNEKSRKLTCVPNIEAIGEPNFLNPNIKKAFNHLQLAFIKAPIF